MLDISNYESYIKEDVIEWFKIYCLQRDSTMGRHFPSTELTWV